MVELRQGTTVIASKQIAQNILTTSFQTFSYILSNSEADSITDYTNLQVRLQTNCSGCAGGSARDRTQVSWIEFSVLDNPPLVPPTLNSVTFINGTSLQLGFSEPSSTFGITSYSVDRSQGFGFSSVKNLTVGTTSYTDTGLIPNSVYTYRMRSLGSTESSVPSNEISQNTNVIIIESLYARPDSVTGQVWDNAVNCPTTRFECVNESIPEYGETYLESDIIGVSNTDQQFLGLSNIQVPAESLDHILRFIAKEAGLGSNSNSLLVELRQGTNVIASVNLPQGSISDVWQLFEYKLSNNEVNSITDYNDLEVRLFTECSGCAGQSARDRTQVSWVEFEVLLIPKPPIIEEIDTLSPSSIKINWSNANLHEHIKRILIQRNDGSGFVTIGNVTNTTTSFIATNLDEGEIYSFRLVGQGSFTNPSDILQGATPPSIQSIIGNGTTIEPNSTNSLTKQQKETFSQTIEHFNVTSSIIDQVITDIEINKLNTYQVIVKMINGTYGSEQRILDTGAYYGTRYVEQGNVTQFLNLVDYEVKIALGNSNGTGDNTNIGVKPDAT